MPTLARPQDLGSRRPHEASPRHRPCGVMPSDDDDDDDSRAHSCEEEEDDEFEQVPLQRSSAAREAKIGPRNIRVIRRENAALVPFDVFDKTPAKTRRETTLLSAHGAVPLTLRQRFRGALRLTSAWTRHATDRTQHRPARCSRSRRRANPSSSSRERAGGWPNAARGRTVAFCPCPAASTMQISQERCKLSMGSRVTGVAAYRLSRP